LANRVLLSSRSTASPDPHLSQPELPREREFIPHVSPALAPPQRG
jgi:hypothetical protein